jgi:hypothetical protein
VEITLELNPGGTGIVLLADIRKIPVIAPSVASRAMTGR